MKQWLNSFLWLALTLLLSSCLPATSPASSPQAPSAVPLPAETPTLAPSQGPTALDTPHRAASPQPRIAFHTNRDGNYEIYVMHADGSEPTNLTNHPARDQSPAWSPDGTRLAFTSDRDGESNLYLIHTDGTRLTRLTHGPGGDQHPAWSPDGSRLAFTAREKGWQIHLIHADGTGRTQVTDLPGYNGAPAWSPTDGSTIAFYYEDKHYASAIHSIEASGANLLRLTSGNTYHDIQPSWSPSGDQIAFASERVGHLKFEIFVTAVRQNSTDPWPEAIQLTDTGGNAWAPDWSPLLPDGSSRILCSIKKDGQNRNIYVMSPDGSNLRQLTNEPADNDLPVWAPLE